MAQGHEDRREKFQPIPTAQADRRARPDRRSGRRRWRRYPAMVSEAKLPVCYISQPKPGLLWKASCFMPREIVWGMTEAEDKDGLKQTLGPLAALGIHWIDGP